MHVYCCENKLHRKYAAQRKERKQKSCWLLGYLHKVDVGMIENIHHGKDNTVVVSNQQMEDHTLSPYSRAVKDYRRFARETFKE